MTQQCQEGTCEHTAYSRTLSRLRSENESLAKELGSLKNVGKKISSVTAVTSQAVKDQNGNECMAILLEDVDDLLTELDQLVR